MGIEKLSESKRITFGPQGTRMNKKNRAKQEKANAARKEAVRVKNDEFIRKWLAEITRSAALFTQQQAIQNAQIDRERAGLT